jgi:tetratricopeptide (TPR) repeat protein
VRAFEQFQIGELSEAEKSALDAMAMTTDNSEQSLTDYGLILLDSIWMKGDSYARAIEFYTSFIESHPDAQLPYKYRAEHYWYNAQPEQALKDYTRVLEFDSEDSGNLLGRGQVFVELGKPSEATADLQKALTILNEKFPSDGNFLPESIAYTRNGLGAANALQGNFSVALREFELSIALQTNNGWVYFNRAKALEQMGETSKALADYKKSLTCQNPKLTPHKRAYVESRLGQLES